MGTLWKTYTVIHIVHNMNKGIHHFMCRRFLVFVFTVFIVVFIGALKAFVGLDSSSTIGANILCCVVCI